MWYIIILYELYIVYITYKDYELHNERDIQELYGAGVITEHRYDLLLKELDDKIKALENIKIFIEAQSPNSKSLEKYIYLFA